MGVIEIVLCHNRFKPLPQFILVKLSINTTVFNELKIKEEESIKAVLQNEDQDSQLKQTHF